MKANLYLSDFTSDSRAYTDIIIGAKNLLAGINRILGHFAVNVIIFISCIPATLLLKYMVIRLLHKIPDNISIQDANDYLVIRNSYNLLSDLLNDLNKVRGIKPDHVPFMLSIVLNQIHGMIAIIENCSHVLKKSIDDLQVSSNNDSLFTPVPEDTIWKAHVPAHNYRL